MRIILPVSLCLAVAAAPLTAQKTGSVNRNAPTVSQSVKYTDGTTIKVSYFALATAKGSTLKSMLDKEGGARSRSRFNRSADNTPLGKFSTSADIDLAGKKITKGDYALRIKISDELKWTMTLTNDGGDMHSFDLKVGDGSSDLPCLQIALTPKIGQTPASMALTFSNLHTKLSMAGKAANASSRRSGGRRK